MDTTLLGGPLEASDDGVLDLVQVLNTLGAVDEEIWSGTLWAEAPDLTGLGRVVLVLLAQILGTDLEVLTWVNLVLVDVVWETIWHGHGLHVQTVVFVGRLGQASLGRLVDDGLTVRDDWVGDLDRDASVVLLEILQADLQVKLTGAGNDVLTGLFDNTLDHRIGLGQSLQAFDQFWQIGGVLSLDGDTHDRRDGELHDTQVVRILERRDGTSLHQELIDTDETANVTARHVLDGLGVSAHHENGSLDGLQAQIVLLAWHVVRAHDAHLLTGGDDTREDTTESVETAFVRGWDHLRDVHHEWTLGVTRLHSYNYKKNNNHYIYQQHY